MQKKGDYIIIDPPSLKVYVLQIYWLVIPLITSHSICTWKKALSNIPPAKCNSKSSCRLPNATRWPGSPHTLLCSWEGATSLDYPKPLSTCSSATRSQSWASLPHTSSYWASPRPLNLLCLLVELLPELLDLPYGFLGLMGMGLLSLHIRELDAISNEAVGLWRIFLWVGIRSYPRPWMPGMLW